MSVTEPQGDTFARSLAHWSEAGRAGMDAFYRLATADYRHLAAARDWRAWLEERQRAAGARPLKLLDVACGSGKFPTALLAHAGVGEAAIEPIDYDLLDPSAFSVAEARAALKPPFEPGTEHVCTLQNLDCPEGAYDIAWATHALYAVPGAEVEAAMARFCQAIGRTGVGLLAHAVEEAHYLAFYRLFLDAFRGGKGEPYTGTERLQAALEAQGAEVEAQDIVYDTAAPESETAAVEGFLQRCVFDDSVPLAAMLEHPLTGPYLAACRQDGVWRFRQRVRLLLVRA